MLPYIIPETRNYTGIRKAIRKASLQGGGTILLENVEYIDDHSGTIMIDSDNIHILGVGNSRIVAPILEETNIFSSSLQIGQSVKLTQNVSKFDKKINVTNTNTFKEYVLITRTVVPNLIEWSQLSTIKRVEDNMLYIIPFIPFDMNVEDHYQIYPVNLIKGFSISNVIFDGRYNTAHCRGLAMNGLADSFFQQISFKNFVNGSGCLLYLGFGNTINNVTFNHCGNVDEGDLMLSYQTNLQVGNLKSINASGFGPELVRCNFNQFSNCSILSAGHRGFKLLGCLHNQFMNIQSHDAESVGIALCTGSQYNQFINCSACANYGPMPGNNEGLWTNGQMNNNNIVSNGVFLHNMYADIFIDPVDLGNVVLNSEYETTYQGCNCDNKIYPNIKSCWFKRTMKVIFGCV